MPEPTDWAEVARLRQGLYRLLGSAYLAPDAERIAQLVNALEYLDTMGVERFSFAPSWDRFIEACERAPPPSRLATEHVRLFASSSEATLCPPVESYYTTSAESGGLGALLGELDRQYRAMGIEVDRSQVEAVDHVAVQMEVMAELCRQEAEAATAGDTAAVADVLATEQGFLAGHLNRWLPLFRDRVAAAAPLPFYERLVELTQVYVAHDLSLLPGLTGLAHQQR